MKRALLLAAVVVAAHARAVFVAGFAYDDGPAILEHPDLREVSRAGTLLFTEYWGADRANQMYRPLQQWSYLVDGAGFAFAPVPSHAIHLAWHVAAVLAAYALLGRLGIGAGARLFAAAAFGVHPALMDASVWISGRCDVQALLFSAASLTLLAGAAPPTRGRAAAAAACFFLGALSKEVALAVPGAALFLFGRRVLRTWPWFLAALGAYVALRLSAVEGFLPGIPNENGVVLHDRSAVERVLIGARAQLLLVLRLFAPHLSVADHRAHPAALPDTEVGVDGALAALAFAAAFAAGARARGPSRAALCARLAAAGACFFVPVLQLWPIGAVMPERFLYVPGFFLVAAAAHAAESFAVRAPRLLPAFAVVVVVAALGARLAARVDVYRDDGTYFRDVLRAYPLDERAWNNLGVFLMKDAAPPDFDGADAAFAEAVRLRPTYRRGRLNAARSILERRRVTHEDRGLARVEDLLGPGLSRGDSEALRLVGRAEFELAELAAHPDDRAIHWERAEAAYARASAWREAALAADRLGAESRAAGYRARR